MTACRCPQLRTRLGRNGAATLRGRRRGEREKEEEQAEASQGPLSTFWSLGSTVGTCSCVNIPGFSGCDSRLSVRGCRALGEAVRSSQFYVASVRGSGSTLLVLDDLNNPGGASLLVVTLGGLAWISLSSDLVPSSPLKQHVARSSWWFLRWSVLSRVRSLRVLLGVLWRIYGHIRVLDDARSGYSHAVPKTLGSCCFFFFACDLRQWRRGVCRSDCYTTSARLSVA